MNCAVAESWFIANVRELRWQENELGATCEFDKHRARFAPKHGAGVEHETPHPKEAYHPLRDRLPTSPSATSC